MTFIAFSSFISSKFHLPLKLFISHKNSHITKYVKYQQVPSNRLMSGVGSPCHRRGSVQLNMKRKTDPYGKAMKNRKNINLNKLPKLLFFK